MFHLSLFPVTCAQPLHIDEWQWEILLVDEAMHVEAFRPEHSELLVLVCVTN